ncbi:hypothetical protein ACU686_07500 [Yinghuangia aomiensis]
MDGKLNQVVVQDFRGGTLGWELTGQIGDFKSERNGAIPGAQLAWTPACAVVNPDSPSPVLTGTAGRRVGRAAVRQRRRRPRPASRAAASSPATRTCRSACRASSSPAPTTATLTLTLHLSRSRDPHSRPRGETQTLSASHPAASS